MAILLTYTSALEALRHEELPGLLAAWDERTGHVPEKPPHADELTRLIAEHPVLRSLTLPLHLLVLR